MNQETFKASISISANGAGKPSAPISLDHSINMEGETHSLKALVAFCMLKDEKFRNIILEVAESFPVIAMVCIKSN